MRILVTGGLGIIGKPLVAELRRRGHEVFVADLKRTYEVAPEEQEQYRRVDVACFRQVEEVVMEIGPDMVYHAAAECGRTNGEANYEAVWHTNAVGTKNVLEMQRLAGFRHVLFSSSEIYGDYDGVMDEEAGLTQAGRIYNDYGISKHVNELQALNSKLLFNTETVRVRPSNIYGPGERYSVHRSAIAQFIYSCLKGLPFKVYCAHHRNPTYVDDGVRTLANIATNFKPGEDYNICGDEYLSMEEIARMALDATGAPLSLAEFIAGREEDCVLNKDTDCSKARRDLGHITLVPVREGIRRTAEWMKGEYRL